MGALETTLRSLASGASPWKFPCRVVSTSNITLSGTQTIDGVALAVGDRVLVAGQTAAAQNGPYTCRATAWTRCDDADEPTDFQLGMTVRVLAGTAYAGSMWVLTSPTTGTVSVNSTALTFSLMELGGGTLPLPSSATLVAPSGDTTGVKDRAAIQAALAAGRHVYLVPGGTYYLDQRIDLTGITDGAIRCLGGRARIVVTTAWAGTLPESLDNCMFKLYEVESATAATTVATTSPMGAQSIVVASATGFAANGWFKVTGISGASDYYRASAGAATESMELLRVDSTYVSGTTIPHGLAQRLWHGANGASKPVKLLTSVVDGFTFENIEFEAPTTEIVNCAIQARFARGVRVIGCAFKGFTGHAVDIKGSRDCEVRDCVFRGWNNGRVSFTSCQKSRAVNCHDRLEPGAPRQNTNGSAQAKYAYRWRYQCYQVELLDCTVEHAVAGFQCWGGAHCKLQGQARDLDFTALAQEDDFLDDEPGQSLFRGVVWDTGGDSTIYAEFGPCNEYDIRADATTTGSTYRHLSQTDVPWNYHGQYFIHDIFDFTLRVRHYSTGKSGSDSTAYAYVGILTQDVTGRIVDSHIRGTVYGFAIRGTYNMIVGDWSHEPQAGQGSAAGHLMVIHEASGGLPTFDTVRWTGGSNQYVFVAGIVDTGTAPYTRPLIRRLVGVPTAGDTFDAEDVWVGRFPNGTDPPADFRAAVFTTGGSAVVGKNLLDPHATTAPTGGTRMAVVFPSYYVFQAPARVAPIVFLGHGAKTPLYVQATAVPLDAREFLEIDSSGRGIALTLAAVADWKKCVGRIKGRLTADGVAQLT